MRSPTLALLIFLIAIPNEDLRAQGLKKVRMGIQSTNIGFLPFISLITRAFTASRE